MLRIMERRNGLTITVGTDTTGRIGNGIACFIILPVGLGEKWTWDVIRGSAQGDWNNVFYPAAAFTEKNIEQFEMLYFNEGTEWMVSDDLDEEPNSLDEIDGMNVYCCAWDADGVKEEIADVCGVSANEVKLYAFSRWARMPVYEAI